MARKALVFLQAGEAELEQAWDHVAKIGNGVTAYEPVTGERWQYLGTVGRDHKDTGTQWEHQFRHRNHPITNRREYLHVRATFGWIPVGLNVIWKEE